jgi:serine/threonine protein kinase
MGDYRKHVERYGPLYRMFMEFVPAGSLSKYGQGRPPVWIALLLWDFFLVGRLLKELGPFQESAARHFTRQLTEGVAYLHRVGIAHRDLKCANLLLTGDGTVKIADFGSATNAADDPKERRYDEDEFTDRNETARWVTPKRKGKERINAEPW